LGRTFSKLQINQKISITVTITEHCAINYIQLTHKKTLDGHKKTLDTRTLDEMQKS